MGDLAKKRFGHESLHRVDGKGRKVTEVRPQKKYLEIKDVIKEYGNFTALKGISLDINEGEFISFLGPSGCGKTTLLRAIAGLDIQTSGTVLQGGEDISALPPNMRDFGIVFQSYALFPNLTVAQNVAYGLESRKTEKDEIARIISGLLVTVGLPGSQHKYPSQLSGGQQQRVALARALATSPGLLLLDEPLSALDAQVRIHLRKEIKALQHKLGVTTIMVTHDQEEAMTMADRIVVMNHGVIEQVGTPQEIYQRPASAFVANFVGTINLMPCFASSEDSIDMIGVQLKCQCDAGLVGQKAVVAIRPEDVVIRNVADGDTNSLDVVIDELEFLGSFARATLSHGRGMSLIAEFSMNVMRDFSIQVGKAVKIALPVEHLRLFPEQ
ncbi:putative 2-aminoethylphosphonate ABC transporter ATP-binding protein [Neptuniibacter halophilus]|uniref:putative 2-aminoethylphosphonate ABC transporter ATP-binding protein n=1 Tax=Neptuniibacter halophilus TaxID=651666 RepID=UPI0025734562|nr:putative 2-aminoethylphosphonate ABC transporter ATP-binding protein [Neptuniibacter halophilus]